MAFANFVRLQTKYPRVKRVSTSSYEQNERGQFKNQKPKLLRTDIYFVYSEYILSEWKQSILKPECARQLIWHAKKSSGVVCSFLLRPHLQQLPATISICYLHAPPFRPLFRAHRTLFNLSKDRAGLIATETGTTSERQPPQYPVCTRHGCTSYIA